MIFEDLREFKQNVKIGKRILGLDLGRKTIGVALSDRDKIIATPRFVIKRKNNEKDIETLYNFILENNIGGVVVGLPLNSKEKETKSSEFVRKFTKILDDKIRQKNNKIIMPIFYQNEYLTSFEAEDFLIDTMSTKCEKTKQIVDKVAAHYILQSILDKWNNI